MNRPEATFRLWLVHRNNAGRNVARSVKRPANRLRSALAGLACALCAGSGATVTAYAEGTPFDVFGSYGVRIGQANSLLGQRRTDIISGTAELAMPVYDRRWQLLLKLAKPLRPRQQLDVVNRYLNALPYRSDDRAYGTPDYWATVTEFLQWGGDCEDYVLAKYRALVAIGFDPDNLRVVLVDDLQAPQSHAVLLARVDGLHFILDNQEPGVRVADEVTRYRPLYSIGGESVYTHLFGDDRFDAAQPAQQLTAGAR